jgi:electron transfer flavoprotein alpha subunit
LDIKVVSELCTGCGACEPACLYGAIEIVQGEARIRETCNYCGACVPSCPFEAIVLTRDEKGVLASPDDYRGVWVFAEQRKGIVQKVAFELLGEGRKLADALGVELAAVLLGSGVESQAQELIWRGAEKVYLVESPELEVYQDEPYTHVIDRLVREHKPEIVLTGATTIGRSLIPRVAVRLRTGLTADCTGLAIDPERRLLLQTRPAFGGNIMATILCERHRPQMSTVRYKVMKEAEVDKSRQGQVIRKEFAAGELTSRTKVVDIVEELTSTVNISEADIIVSGGRGVGGPENFRIIEELAQVLGGAMGASRAAVDSGWVPYSHQVGQTGKTVCPKLYIACGISGAIQHLAGMQSSDCIVAINRDPEAPIFKVANYGLVGDLFYIVPKLAKKLRERCA